jgi:diacylglycerol kinase family enzyme
MKQARLIYNPQAGGSHPCDTNAAGPRLQLAPNAKANDGLLDVVMISEDQRVGFLAYLNGVIAGNLERLPNVSVQKVKTLELYTEAQVIAMLFQPLGTSLVTLSRCLE